MATVDKWAMIMALLALIVVVTGLVVVGGTARDIGNAGGLGAFCMLVYALGRVIREMNR